MLNVVGPQTITQTEMTDFESANRDLSTQRVYELEHNKVILERRDPFGFWHFKLEKGPLPESMRGTYTSVREAELALHIYLNDRNKTIAGKETHKIKSVTT